MDRKQPPDLPTASVFLIGRDRAGHWVVQDQAGLNGGLFIDRAQALKFALFENRNRPRAVVMVPGTIELGATGSAPPSVRREQKRRRAA